jgi:beta-aspartyl-peptidase (threonine type)
MSSSWTLALHGGAGTIARATMSDAARAAHLGALHAALEAGAAILRGGGSAEEAVVAAVLALEDCPLFNAGHGSTLTAAGTVEMDAALMLSSGRAGAVTGVTRLRNPILAARAVMRADGAVLLAGPGADAFGEAQGLATAPPGYFETPQRRAQLLAAQRAGAMALDHDGGRMGTVGAVARDRAGRLAAATSTGGMTNKPPGRVGDSPILGAGTWADPTVAVSCTGTGEAFLRVAAAHEVSARMRLGGEPLDVAAGQVIRREVPAAGGRGGLVAVDARGNAALPFGTEGMYRGVARAGAAPWAAIHA